MKRLLSPFVLLLLVCLPAAATDDVVIGGHSSVETRHGRGVLAADQPAAEQIGNAILADGGDAVDAAVATALALGVENPSSSGLGGGGFALIWRADQQRLYALDFRERAPAAADASRYRGPDGTLNRGASRWGCLAAGVPGELAGLAAMHRRFGELDWKSVVEPAHELARDGVEVSAYLAWASRIMADRMGEFPEAASAYENEDGSPLQIGQTRKDPELATLLGRIAQEGPDVFYRGDVARSIGAACADVEGAVTARDLADYQIRWRTPVVGRYDGLRIASMPPPSSGGAVMIEILNILEPWWMTGEPPDPGSPKYLHQLTEAMKHGFADRATFFGDPDYVDVPLRRLTSKSYAAELRSLIDPIHTRQTTEYGAAGVEGAGLRVLGDDSGTTHLSVIDEHGNAVALTSSVNLLFGSLVRVPGVGIVLNDTMNDFTLDPGVPNAFGLTQSSLNAIVGGKRPLSSMSPLIALDDEGRAVLVAGASGGPRIITGTLQVAVGALVYGESVSEAEAAPRIHHQWLPNVLYAEEAVPDSTLQSLRARGHQTKRRGAVGNVQVVKRLPDGSLEGAADPRKNH